MNPTLVMIRIKIWIVAYATQKAKRNPITNSTFTTSNIDPRICTSRTKENINAARMRGMERRNENFADSFREKPSERQAAIVIPERDIPGISARD